MVNHPNRSKVGLVGASYWTVNVPSSLRYAERKEILNRLAEAGFTSARRHGRNTRQGAEALAADIKARLGVQMEVNETADLWL